MPVIDLDRIKEQGKRFVDGFTPGQKAMTILGIVAVVFAGMTFMKWASAPDYAPLYTGLSSQDAGAVTQQLDAQNVKYKITGDGGTIMVPRQVVYKTRADLSTKGLPNGGGDSFALLDKQGITTDQFTRNVDYQRALQGELGRTIEAIDGISSASVNLTIPQQTVFVGSDQDQATAAVLVKSTGTISDSTVQAIVHLVASSIPNMNPDNVTVADANGKVLHAPGVDSTAGAAVEQQHAYEAAVQQKVSDMIARTLGPGHAAVTVSADLDLSKHETKTQTVTRPAGATTDVPTRSSTSSETLTSNGSAGTGGQLGVGGTQNPALGGSGGTSNYSKNTTTQENALDTSSDSSVTPPGTVKRIAVSVLLDQAVVKSPADVTNIWQPQIANAAGVLPSRDGANAVTVTAIPFTDEAKKASASATATPASGSNPMFDLIKHVLTLLMIALVLFFAWRAIKRAETNRVPLRVPLDLRELEASHTSVLDTAGVAAAVAAPAARRPLEPPPQTLEGEISELIERQPEEVAQTLRSWLADRRG